MSEEPMLSNLIRQLASEFTCPGVTVTSYVLHRKGPGSSDQFGSDIAVTLTDRAHQFFKAAIFQVKLFESKAKINRKQLEMAQCSPFWPENCFVLGVAKHRTDGRVNAASELLAEIGTNRYSRGIPCSAWIPLQEWIDGWLACNHGTNIGHDSKLMAALEGLKNAQTDLPNWAPQAIVEILVNEG